MSCGKEIETHRGLALHFFRVPRRRARFGVTSLLFIFPGGWVGSSSWPEMMPRLAMPILCVGCVPSLSYFLSYGTRCAALSYHGLYFSDEPET